jgi:hypothetical protein
MGLRTKQTPEQATAPQKQKRGLIQKMYDLAYAVGTRINGGRGSKRKVRPQGFADQRKRKRYNEKESRRRNRNHHNRRAFA